MISLTCQKVGDEIVVGIKGDTSDEVKHQFWSFWNHKATSGELHNRDGIRIEQPKSEDPFGYFWSKPKAFKKAVRMGEFYRLRGEMLDGLCGSMSVGSMLGTIKARAASRIKAMESAEILPDKEEFEPVIYSVVEKSKDTDNYE
jgi:hypothetical protein